MIISKKYLYSHRPNNNCNYLISNSAGIKRTHIFYNHENISRIILNLVSTSKTKIDVCGDRMIHIFPYLIT